MEQRNNELMTLNTKEETKKEDNDSPLKEGQLKYINIFENFTEEQRKKIREHYESRNNTLEAFNKNDKKYKENLDKSLIELCYNISEIKSWDEIMELVDNDENEGYNKKIVNCTNNKNWLFFNFIILGNLFVIFHLIGIQEMIKVMNAILNELIQEGKLKFLQTKRTNTFYEEIRFSTFRNIPDIDVALFFNFLGETIFKCFGYFFTNLLFEGINLFFIILFFYGFHFHVEDELNENYFKSEIIILILSYLVIFVCIGSVSMLSLQEYFRDINFYFEFKEKNNNNKDNENNESNDDDKSDDLNQSWLFCLLCGISLILDILLNKLMIKIFKNDINRRRYLLGITILYILSFILSSLFYLLYQIVFGFENYCKSEKKKNKKNKVYNQDEVELVKSNINEKIKQSTYTLCGYICYRKENKNDIICTFYSFQSWNEWLKDNFGKEYTIYAIIMTLLFKSQILGFKPKIEDNFNEDFTEKKSMNYILIYIGSFIIIYLLIVNLIWKKVNKKFTSLVYLTSSIFGFIGSIIVIIISFLALNNLKENIFDIWLEIIMIFYSLLDFLFLNLFDLFGNNNDILNTSLFITFFRFIWDIISSILESKGITDKKVIYKVQISISIFTIIILVLFLIQKRKKL